MSNLLGISEAADLLGVSTKTIRRWESDGKLKAVRTVRGQGDSQGLVKSFKTELTPLLSLSEFKE